MKKWILNQGLLVHSVTRDNITMISNSIHKIELPKSDWPLLTYLGGGARTEEEIKEWMSNNPHKTSFEKLVKDKLLTNVIIDQNSSDSSLHSWLNILETKNNFYEEVKGKSVLLIGNTDLNIHFVEQFAKMNIDKIVIFEDGRVKPTHTINCPLVDRQDVGRFVVETLKKKLKDFSKTEIIGYPSKIDDASILEEVRVKHNIDFVIFTFDGDEKYYGMCYKTFVTKSIPFTSCGMAGTEVFAGPLLWDKNKTFENIFITNTVKETLKQQFQTSIFPISFSLCAFIASFVVVETIKNWSYEWASETTNTRVVWGFLNTWDKKILEFKSK